ncbi:MAG: RNA polymerase sigma factor [Prevotella sp.]|nr:RNA polymerase sigma factor [Prevotella sp.]
MAQGQLLAMLADPERREEGFRLLMRQYGKTLYWHIRRIVVSHDDAEDALQETCIKIVGGIENFRGESGLRTWIYRIATNEALHQLRRQTHLFQSIDALSDKLRERLEAETPLDSEAAEVLFQKALLTLPTQQRIAFNLHYYDELNYDEIARITGKKAGTLRTNYHFATEKIKNYIKEHSL